jgi:hypothetical protein
MRRLKQAWRRCLRASAERSRSTPPRVHREASRRRAEGRRPYTGERAAKATADHGIALDVVKLPEAKCGLVLLPRRWVVERVLAWMARFRRSARDDERLPATLAGLHRVAFSVRLLRRAADFAAVRHSLGAAQRMTLIGTSSIGP